MEDFVTIVMCALEINSPSDCLIYGQAHIKAVSGGSMHSVTESTSYWDQTDLCSNPASWYLWNLVAMFKLLGLQFSNLQNEGRGAKGR